MALPGNTITEGEESNIVSDDVFLAVDYIQSKLSFAHYRHAAHVMIFSREQRVLWNKHPFIANVMMQVRFDGALGFPGGLLDDTDENPVEGLNRELVEEMGVSGDTCVVQETDYLISEINHHRQLVTHFYVKEVTLDKYELIESGVRNAHEWGEETLGILRVPLFTMSDGKRGLPLFLTNSFAGNARQQLKHALITHSILDEESVEIAFKTSNSLISK